MIPPALLGANALLPDGSMVGKSKVALVLVAVS